MLLTWMKRLALALLILLLLAVIAIWWLLRGSLPHLDGELSLPGLSAPVSIQRDKLGVATIEAASEADAMRALGYVHAQERYFEMDLMRRTAAGELAGLFGERALKTDIDHRMHRFRARVTRDLDAIAGDKRRVLQAYVEGVNAGLAGLEVRPWPYLLLRTAAGAVATRRLRAGRLRDVFRPAGRGQLARAGVVEDQAGGAGRAVRAARPRRQQLGCAAGRRRARRRDPAARPISSTCAALPAPRARHSKRCRVARELGSNNFAVSGALTEDGRAIVANDMHLTLRAPNIWFRARLRYARCARAGRQGRRRWLHPARAAAGGGGQQRPCRVGLHQQLRRLARLAGGRRRARAAAACAGTTTHRERIDVARRRGSSPCWSTRPRGARCSAIRRRHTACLALGRAPARRGQSRMARRGARSIVRPGARRRRTQRDPGPEPRHRRDATAASAGGSWARCRHAPPHAMATTVGNASGHACPPWSFRTDDTPRVIDPPEPSPVDRQQPRRRRHRAGPARRWRLRQRRARQADPRSPVRETALRRTRPARDPARRPCAVPAALVATAARRGHAGEDAGVAAHSPTPQRTWPGRASTDAVSHRIVRAWRLAVHARIADGLVAPAKVGAWRSIRHACPAPIRRRGVAAGDAATAAPAATRFATWDALFEDAAAGSARRTHRTGPAVRAQLGRAEHRAHLPSARRRTAVVRTARAVHAIRSVARRHCHAARAIARHGRIRTHGGVARATKPTASSTCLADKAGIRCRRSGAPGMTTGCGGGRRRSCRDRRDTRCASYLPRTEPPMLQPHPLRPYPCLIALPGSGRS